MYAYLPTAHFGVIGSGEKVLTDTAPILDVQRLFTNFVGVEMEGVGAALSAHENLTGAIDFLLIKAICDWADPNKADAWQPYAASVAAAYAVQIAQNFIEEQKTENGDEIQNGLIVPNVKETHGTVSKLLFVRRLGDSWKDLADAFGIPPHEKKRFEFGDEPRALYEYVESRGKLSLLPEKLAQIERSDLIESASPNPTQARKA